MKKILLGLSLIVFNSSSFADIYITNISPGQNQADTFKVTYKSCVQIPSHGKKCGPSETSLLTGDGTIPLSADTVDFIIESIDMPYGSYHVNCAGLNNQAFALLRSGEFMLCSIATAYAKASLA